MFYRLIQRPLTTIAFLLFLMIPTLEVGPVQAESPFAKDTVQLDWVCVADGALVEAFAPLAAHRQSQGLNSIVLPMEEVIRWSPAGDDTVATLRWLSTVAVNQWGTRYLLLGGSHAMLPAPIHRLDNPNFEWDHPIDSYYSCLDGDWDVDGDGFYAEHEEDAADPTLHLALGRIPVDDYSGVQNWVAKVLAFEERPMEITGGALLVSSLMNPNWNPDSPYPNPVLGFAISLSESVAEMRPDLRVGTLFQGSEWGPPEENTLNPRALVDSLRLRSHDFVFVQLAGNVQAWELVSTLTIDASEFLPLAESGHSFLMTMVSGAVADTRTEGVLASLLSLPNGGLVGAVAPTGTGYLFLSHTFQDLLWEAMLAAETERLGDAFVMGLQGLGLDESFPGFWYSTYWYQAIMGDPATLLQTTADDAADVPVVTSAHPVKAIPNPFNPETTIHFEVTGPQGVTQPVQVEVFNLQGRLVKTLLEDSLLPGPHSVTWSDGQVSGLYFARVTVAGRAQTAKLTLVE